MSKSATTKRKAATRKVAASVAKPHKSAAQRVRELPAAERRKRLHALMDEVEAFWKGKPDTGALAHLLKLRRGEG